MSTSYEEICRKLGFDIIASKIIDVTLTEADIIKRVEMLSDEEKNIIKRYYDDVYCSFKKIPNNITLDFSCCSNILDIHYLLKEKFGFPEYYGKNWNAFWDCINGLFWDDRKYIIQITSFSSLDNQLKDYCKPMLEIFKEIEEKENNVSFLFE